MVCMYVSERHGTRDMEPESGNKVKTVARVIQGSRRAWGEILQNGLHVVLSVPGYPWVSTEWMQEWGDCVLKPLCRKA